MYIYIYIYKHTYMNAYINKGAYVYIPMNKLLDSASCASRVPVVVFKFKC